MKLKKNPVDRNSIFNVLKLSREWKEEKNSTFPPEKYTFLVGSINIKSAMLFLL